MLAMVVVVVLVASRGAWASCTMGSQCAAQGGCCCELIDTNCETEAGCTGLGGTCVGGVAASPSSSSSSGGGGGDGDGDSPSPSSGDLECTKNAQCAGKGGCCCEVVEVNNVCTTEDDCMDEGSHFSVCVSTDALAPSDATPSGNDSGGDSPASNGAPSSDDGGNGGDSGSPSSGGGDGDGDDGGGGGGRLQPVQLVPVLRVRAAVQVHVPVQPPRAVRAVRQLPLRAAVQRVQPVQVVVGADACVVLVVGGRAHAGRRR
eukprot:CAMPEP_0198366344 /NCGR_PEP_ID=MMETSP1450-20131203/154634_1 /TAXON_ID=753684 ORGANISM="Madagascaria erythrocladiodes, Strain CCMP3234" /NCGR_SAMPLE_ID=MMETSP1450 /ASSEMBLY_ACC=CAM_ASM_001115 /LENGTH=259 /DNA_ID=CAMNT_0044073809 /DNA_START=96 /DNA_END=872 /DNA_ORIENTATION=+